MHVYTKFRRMDAWYELQNQRTLNKRHVGRIYVEIWIDNVSRKESLRKTSRKRRLRAALTLSPRRTQARGMISRFAQNRSKSERPRTSTSGTDDTLLDDTQESPSPSTPTRYSSRNPYTPSFLTSMISRFAPNRLKTAGTDDTLLDDTPDSPSPSTPTRYSSRNPYTPSTTSTTKTEYTPSVCPPSASPGLHRSPTRSKVTFKESVKPIALVKSFETQLPLTTKSPELSSRRPVVERCRSAPGKRAKPNLRRMSTLQLPVDAVNPSSLRDFLDSEIHHSVSPDVKISLETAELSRSESKHSPLIDRPLRQRHPSAVLTTRDRRGLHPATSSHQIPESKAAPLLDRQLERDRPSSSTSRRRGLRPATSSYQSAGAEAVFLTDRPLEQEFGAIEPEPPLVVYPANLRTNGSRSPLDEVPSSYQNGFSTPVYAQSSDSSSTKPITGAAGEQIPVWSDEECAEAERQHRRWDSDDSFHENCCFCFPC